MAHKYITRVDSDSTHSWRVRIMNEKPEQISATFTDSRYGGEGAAEQAAIVFRDKALRKHRAIITRYAVKARKAQAIKPWSKVRHQRHKGRRYVEINNKNYRAIFAYYFNFTTKKRTNKTFRIKKSKAYAIQQAKKWLREQDAEC